jgi:hypothetical protein
MTSHDFPRLSTDVAEILERWESLPPEVKAEVLRLIREN